jgi:type II secretory pathway pseudopilin PulG
MKKNNGFTIVELLTSIVIIVLLLGLLLPSLAKIRRSAKEAAQKVQFATIDTALEAFRQDYGDYPPSDQYEDIIPAPPIPLVYCGAQKLTEALLGFDLMGFHPKTAWTRDGYDSTHSYKIYDFTDANLHERKGPYLEVAKTPVFRLAEIAAGANNGLYNYNTPELAPFDKGQANWVICDVFGVKKIKDASEKIVNAGTPVLYYKANTSSKSLFCPAGPGSFDAAKNSIYNYYDNLPLLGLRMLPGGTSPHYLFPPPNRFCNLQYKIIDTKIPYADPVNGPFWPNRPDSYILISAGADHNFGTNDDILNF